MITTKSHHNNTLVAGLVVDTAQCLLFSAGLKIIPDWFIKGKCLSPCLAAPLTFGSQPFCSKIIIFDCQLPIDV